jgi:pentatricopeptide repeat protein
LENVPQDAISICVTWTAILGGCAMDGHDNEALQHFERMCEVSVQPDDITFVCFLSACSHAGLVAEACAVMLQ